MVRSMRVLQGSMRFRAWGRGLQGFVVFGFGAPSGGLRSRLTVYGGRGSESQGTRFRSCLGSTLGMMAVLYSLLEVVAPLTLKRKP